MKCVWNFSAVLAYQWVKRVWNYCINLSVREVHVELFCCINLSVSEVHVELYAVLPNQGVKYDDVGLFQGHIRVGRALLCKNKAPGAVKAFSNAFNALDRDATDVQKKDVLKELVKTITVHMGTALVLQLLS